MRAIAAALALTVAACAEDVSPPPLGDYTTWYRVDTYGDAPGHGASYRVIYVNDVARTSGPIEADAVLVKEIRDDDGGRPGALRYVAIMRKLRAGPDPADEGGWLFTKAATPGGAETHSAACWNRCHAQAPLAGVWLDYTQFPAPP
ncbi:MAG: hypothetical protein IPL61_31355 [Myxococcales bacterium]|nr:hypothetical protein [Myxococcales bacterium]